MSYTYTDKIKFAYTPNFDSFNRLRVSSPFTLFDSSNRFRDNGLWATLTESSGSATFNTSQGLMDLTVNSVSGSNVIRETYKLFPYQPGKSLLVMNTFVFNSGKTGLRQRVGYFGSDNGFYLELNDSSLSFIRRSSVTGILSETPITQGNWNVDKMDGTGPSGVTLDITKAQILWMDFEWLGTGSVRCGFVVGGEFYTCHVFHHANLITTTYITTACLPCRYEITNTSATGSSSTLKQICSTVLSEGGYELRGEAHTVSTPINSPLPLTVAGTFYPIVSIRLKSTRLNGIAIPTGMTCLPQNSGTYQWSLVEGGITSGGTWVSSGTDSVIEYNITGTGFSGGTQIHSGFFTGSNQGSASSGLSREGLLDHQLSRNSFTSTPYEFTLCIAAEAIGGGKNVWGIMDWEEITR